MVVCALESPLSQDPIRRFMIGLVLDGTTGHRPDALRQAAIWRHVNLSRSCPDVSERTANLGTGAACQPESIASTLMLQSRQHRCHVWQPDNWSQV